MTLIIGIKCQGGFVLGSDGAATYGSRGNHTIRQSVKKKLQLVSSQAVVGVAGAVGVGQRLAGLVDELVRAGKFTLAERSGDKRELKLSNCKSHDVMSCLRLQFWNVIGPETEAARMMAQAIGHSALSAAMSDSLVCLLVGNEPRLYQFDQQAAPEEITSDLPFVSIGSGQSIADPFLAFLRRIYWNDRLPTIDEGIFTTVWTLRHAIETNPGGVGDPKQIVTFTREGDNVWRAKELPEEKIDESLQSIESVEQRLAVLPRQQINSTMTTTPPPEPESRAK